MVNRANKPLVSIIVPTYNHEAYIQSCLEGIFMQVINFPIEIIIGDDNSKDRNRERILESLEKNNDPLKNVVLLFHEKNLSQPPNLPGKLNFMDCLKKCQGKYVALCEGDDYWSNSYKLQRQVELLEKRPEYSLVYHNVESNRSSNYRFQKANDFSFYLEDSLSNKQGSTLSIMFRNFLFQRQLPTYFSKAINGDWCLEVISMTLGKGYYMKETMGFYRHHESGITKEANFIRKANRAKWYFILNMIFWAPKHSVSFMKFLYRNRAWARYKV